MAKEATLKIGNSYIDNKAAMKDVSASINDIFESAFKNHIEQNTIIAALEALGKIAKVENVTVTNSVFNGDKTVNMNDPITDQDE